MSTPTPSSRRPSRRPSAALAGLAAAVLLAGCASDTGEESGTARPFDPEHVHGLAEDPVDGSVLVATHDGLFALADGAEAPVARGGLSTDLMGFAVAGDGAYLASGHPGEGEDGHGDLGLVSSEDQGTTWEEVSLGGQADFHALSTGAGAIYGVDAGTSLLRSDDDGATWQASTLPSPVAALAVDDRSGTVVATTQDGPVRVDEERRRLEPLDGAPLLQLVDFAADGTLVGITPDGRVAASDDLATWTEGAGLGAAPQALAVLDGGDVVVATAGALLRSTDGGASFSTVVDW